ncbi:MAG: hypothetical protein KA965_08725 [Butyrivibrio sp.]|nr:hypothetical protein [Butyrivibrio sp.]
MKNTDLCIKERYITMAAISKPACGAFVLSNEKVPAFLSRKGNTASDAINRFKRKANTDTFRKEQK